MPLAVIADDEPHLATFLRDRLAALWPELTIASVAPNGQAALEAIAAHTPDIAFLDIKMPGLTGLQVAERVTDTHIVFVTAYDEFALNAFEREAVDYVLKPITDERLAQTVARLKRRLDTKEEPPAIDSLLAKLAAQLQTGGKPSYLRWLRALKGEVTYQIPVEDVLYLDAEDKYTVIYTRDGESLIRTALSEIGAQLDPETFWQIHRSTIVNMNHVAATRRDLSGRLFVQIRDWKKELAVSRQYVHLFKQH